MQGCLFIVGLGIHVCPRSEKGGADSIMTFLKTKYYQINVHMLDRLIILDKDLVFISNVSKQEWWRIEIKVRVHIYAHKICTFGLQQDNLPYNNSNKIYYFNNICVINIKQILQFLPYYHKLCLGIYILQWCIMMNPCNDIC